MNPAASSSPPPTWLDRVQFGALVFVPVALLLHYTTDAGPVLTFIAAALAIVPLAGWMGRATERLAEHVGEGIGGLLNATFGNAAELIIAVFALRAGLHDLVKASLTGSIIGNILLVFGLSACTGGLRYRILTFNRTAASMGASMLFLSTVALVIPAVFHLLAGPDAALSEHRMSLFIAVVLLVTYALGLVFYLRTHSHLYTAGTHADHGSGPPAWSARRALGVLVGCAVAVGVMSEMLVASAEHAAQTVGMSEVFVGVIVVAIIGNAAEHSTAVLMAWKNKMDLSLNIAIGSSIQIALFVAPLLVLLSYLVGPAPMDLRFTTMEIVAVATSVGIIVIISQDGETHWMEGFQLLAIYTILAVAFFFL